MGVLTAAETILTASWLLLNLRVASHHVLADTCKLKHQNESYNLSKCWVKYAQEFSELLQLSQTGQK